MDAALFELLLFFGIVLGLAAWELYRVTRSLRGPPGSADDGAGDDAGEERSGRGGDDTA